MKIKMGGTMWNRIKSFSSDIGENGIGKKRKKMGDARKGRGINDK